ncbi:MAG TPA: hypothetical protein PK002_06820 [Cellvibrio sp.]|nr:hypothetical protein [Cellvibrio sp.]
MRNLILLPLTLAFSTCCFGINLEGNSAQKVYLTFNEPLETVSKDWSLLTLKSYLDKNVEIDEAEFLAASKLGKLVKCENTKLTGPNTPKLMGNVSYGTNCTFSNGVGKVEIQAEFSENGEYSKIHISKVTPI